MSSCYKNIEIDGCKAIVLSLELADATSEITVANEFGANLLRYVRNGKNIIDFDYDTFCKRDFTGTPVLFPTPNRVFGAHVIYNGKVYHQQKNGLDRINHGLVYDEPFAITDITCGDNSAKIELCYYNNKNLAHFNSFPFECKLYVTYSIDVNGLTIDYKLENLCDEDFQYGFCVHPYFIFGENARLILPSKIHLELDDHYPTKKINNTEDIYPGINTVGIDIDSLTIDDDFSRDGDKPACIISDDIRIEVCAAKQFRHFVVYKNRGDNFICIEPQTNCINAHNLAAEGFEYANVININSKDVHTGQIRINVEDRNDC